MYRPNAMTGDRFFNRMNQHKEFVIVGACLLLSSISEAGDVAACVWKNLPSVQLAIGDLVFRCGHGD